MLLRSVSRVLLCAPVLAGCSATAGDDPGRAGDMATVREARLAARGEGGEIYYTDDHYNSFRAVLR